MTITVVLVLVVNQDKYGFLAMAILIFSRLLNVLVIQSRSKMGWKGASEPGVEGDLLVLLSQDRWVRMRGAVDDLKAVTSGQWLREPTLIQNLSTMISQLLVYLDVSVVARASQEAKLALLAGLVSSAILLEIANEYTCVLKMYGRTVRVDESPKKYPRRLDLAQELIKETGRDDWAIQLGMIQSRNDAASEVLDSKPKIM